MFLPVIKFVTGKHKYRKPKADDQNQQVYHENKEALS